MKLTLQLHYDAAPAPGPVVAWFIAGADPERCVAELVVAGWANLTTRIYAVPRSVADAALAGWLVVPGGEAPPVAPPAGMPCRCLAGKLYLPLPGRLEPPVTDDEIRALGPEPLYFWHPTHGLSGFPAGAALTVGNLLTTPAVREADALAARAGTPPLPDFGGVDVVAPPATPWELYGDAAAEIGGQPPATLPPAPNEPGTGSVAQTTRNLQQAFWRAVQRLADAAPETATRPTIWNRLADQAARRLQSLEALLNERLRELHRLRRTFDTDPDAALRHAPPLTGPGCRGTARPSARLGRRAPDYSAERLRGGGPGDAWAIPTDVVEDLRREYRKAANREIQLGRHRRAAYIFAELLGEHLAAANCLRQGGWYREAAELFERQLHNPLAAAQCLAAGGFHAEAAARYESRQRWREAAEAYEKGGEPASAARLYRQLVEEHKRQGDPVSAADLLAGKLACPDEALACLRGAWPNGAQAVPAVTAEFQLLGQLGRHAAARERLRELRQTTGPKSRHGGRLLEFTAGLARNYPDAALRPEAADFCRVLVAARLQAVPDISAVAAPAVGLLPGLCPEDPLVVRDMNRYLARLRSTELQVRRRTPEPPVPAHQPRLPLLRLSLAPEVVWRRMVGDGTHFYALGHRDGQICLTRGGIGQAVQTLAWSGEPEEAPTAELYCAATPAKGNTTRVILLTRHALPERIFPATDGFATGATAGTPAWLWGNLAESPSARGATWSFHGLAAGVRGTWTLATQAGRLILNSFDNNCTRLRTTMDLTRDLAPPEDDARRLRVRMVEAGLGVAVALEQVLLLSDGHRQCRFHLPEPIEEVCPIPGRSIRVLVCLGTKVLVCQWGNDQPREFWPQGSSARGAFLHPGLGVLVGRNLMAGLQMRGGKPVLGEPRRRPGAPPIAVAPAGGPGRFACLSQRGEVTIHPSPFN